MSDDDIFDFDEDLFDFQNFDLDNFDYRKLVRRGDPDTSVEAAKQTARNLKERQRVVWILFSYYPYGITNWGLEVIEDRLHGSGWRSRVPELRAMGLLILSPIRRYAPDSLNPGNRRLVHFHTKFVDNILFKHPHNAPSIFD